MDELFEELVSERRIPLSVRRVANCEARTDEECRGENAWCGERVGALDLVHQGTPTTVEGRYTYIYIYLNHLGSVFLIWGSAEVLLSAVGFREFEEDPKFFEPIFSTKRAWG